MMILWGNCLLVAEALLALTLITLILNKPPKVAHKVELILADKYSGGYLYFIIPLIGQRPCLVQSMGLKADTGCNRALTNLVVCSWTFCICSMLHVLHERASCLYVLHLLGPVCAEIIVQASANKPSWRECSANKPCGRQGPYGTLGHGVINEANTC